MFEIASDADQGRLAVADRRAAEGGNGTTARAVVPRLEAGWTYTFRVEASHVTAEGAVGHVASTTAYSAPLLVAISGPGAPHGLRVRDVTHHSLHLLWTVPAPDATSGVWHGDGGAPLIG